LGGNAGGVVISKDIVHIGLSTSVIQRGQSGVGQYVLALTRALLAQGKHQYTIFVLKKDLELFQFAAHEASLIVVPEWRRRPALDILWHQTVLPGKVKRLGLDVLHVPSYRRMLWPKPCPLVATIHDLAPFSVPQKYNWLRMFYGRRVVPRLARRQDQIIAPSENTAADIAKFFRTRRETLTVIHNGLDHGRFFPGDATQARSLNAGRFNLDQPFFLYVARLEHPGKNHIRLIEAFNRFKSITNSKWQLVFAGGDWHGAHQIREAIRQSPVTKDIRSLGFVADAWLPDLYRAAEVFVYPSLFEGFGIPPIEAMACGCPVISSARGSLGEVLGNAAAYVDPESIEDLTIHLTILATNPAIRNQWRAAGLERARRFDWALTAAATVNVYEKAAASPRH
jgi:glycosyltransferase involved in cell wall biosynthesis